MNFNYKINGQKHEVVFCPDNQGVKIRKKVKAYMHLTKDLKKIKHDGKILLVIDKNIIYQYLI